MATALADREASSQAGELAGRLAEIDLHQREARYLLERAGMLERRRLRAAETDPQRSDGG